MDLRKLFSKKETPGCAALESALAAAKKASKSSHYPVAVIHKGLQYDEVGIRAENGYAYYEVRGTEKVRGEVARFWNGKSLDKIAK